MIDPLIDCPGCGETFEGSWPARVGQDPGDAPVAEQTCPNGHKFQAEDPRWSFFGEAG